jgi:hypothetical protein
MFEVKVTVEVAVEVKKMLWAWHARLEGNSGGL